MVKLSSALGVGFLGLAVNQWLVAETKAPNILFIFTDDHSSNALSIYGSKINKTPNLDRIGKDGAVFDRCYVANAISGPSRACIMTGMHSHSNGKIDNYSKISTNVRFPKYLQAAGYTTAVIGKWHLGDNENPSDYGFDHWMVYINQGTYYTPEYRTKEGRKRFPGEYSVECTTDLAMKWLDTQKNGDKPFLLMCQYKAPHRTWSPGPKYLKMYDDITIPEPDNLFDDLTSGDRNTKLKDNAMSIAKHLHLGYDLKVDTPNIGWAGKVTEIDRMNAQERKLWEEAYNPKNDAFRKANLKGKDLVRWKYQRYIKDYLRCVAAVDDNVGRLLDYLDKNNLSENTVVIYSSDQGFFLGEHGLYDKRYVYEEALKMPFLIRWPKVIKAGVRRSQIVQNIDFAPTFLDIAGVEIPKEMQGKSMVSTFESDKNELRDAAYYHYYESPSEHQVPAHFALINKRYKLVRYYAFGNTALDQWEMFDMQNDPKEMVNIFNNKKYENIRNKMIEKLKEKRKKFGNKEGNLGFFE